MTPIGRQRGAALVVGLLLLLILTMLAISTMSSASVEFIMAGNEQYHQNAFQNAETGVAQTIATTTFTPGMIPQPVDGVLSTTDSYSARYTVEAGGVGLSPDIWAGSRPFAAGQASSFHYEIRSTGTSARGTQATNVQGLAQIAPPNGGSWQQGQDAPPDLSPPGS